MSTIPVAARRIAKGFCMIKGRRAAIRHVIHCGGARSQMLRLVGETEHPGRAREGLETRLGVECMPRFIRSRFFRSYRLYHIKT